MAAIEVSVRNNLFPQIAARFPVATRDARRKAIARTIDVADPLTPVNTGLLRANKVVTDDSIHWAQEYAGHQNYGTVRGIVGKRFVDQGVEAGLRVLNEELDSLEGSLV